MSAASNTALATDDAALNVYNTLNAQERLEFMAEAKKLGSTHPLERKPVLEELAEAARMTLERSVVAARTAASRAASV